MSREQTRRGFVIATGSIGAALLAGCAGAGGGSSADDGSMDDSMTEEGSMMTEESMTEEGSMMGEPADPASAPRTAVDRFSDAAGTLMRRSADGSLPGSDEPIDFDRGPFITRGLTPEGGTTRYYNFDVQPTSPAPIYVLFREGEATPVDGQLNIVDAVPGDDGYNDFWHVHAVTVPADYEANTATSLDDLQAAGYPMAATDTLVNCPVVPAGSTASLRLGDGAADLVEGWYRGQVVTYFEFTEAPLSPVNGAVPLSPIYVSFNLNPGEEGGGPPSGFKIEAGSDQTHNVVASVPGDPGYSPLWSVTIYDNADFDDVSDFASARDATVLASGAATVNCPIVSLG